MSVWFVIEDEMHADHMGRFTSRAEALAELERLAALGRDASENQVPCGNPRCGRRYELLSYDDATRPWRLLRRDSALDVDADGVRWHPDFER